MRAARARVCVCLVCLLLFSVRGEQHSSEGDEGYGERRERMSEVTSFTEVSVEIKILPGGANMAQLIVAGFVGLTNEVPHGQNQRVTWDCDIVTLKVRADRCPVLSQKEKGGGVCFLVNQRWCNDAKPVSQSCSVELETLIINCRPFYSPREFSSVVLVGVYIPLR